MMELWKILERFLDIITSFNIQLLAASLLPCLTAPRRKCFPVRFTAVLIPYTILFVAYRPNEILTFGWFHVGFILCYFWLIGLLWLCFEITVSQAFFYTTTAYVVQHLLYWVKVLLEILIAPNGRDLRYFVISFLMMAGVLCGYEFLFIRRYKQDETVQLKNPPLQLFCVFMLFVVNVVSQFSQNVLHESMRVSVCLYAGMCCILLLVLQFRIFDRSRVEREQAIAEQLLHEAEKQQRMFKESLDVINLKCHDLKHQIAALKQIDSAQEREKVIAEAENAVNFLKAIAKTGNETLDVVLTEKCLQAEKYGIQLTYIADGSLLDFFTTADLASFFGNILENAIEGVKDAEPEKRNIYFSVDKRGEYAWIHCENWCSGSPTFRDGFPVTMKTDREHHGFGVVSLRLIAEKYGAQLRMENKDNMFYVDALFPQPAQGSDC